jgi:hypothetical protein
MAAPGVRRAIGICREPDQRTIAGKSCHSWPVCRIASWYEPLDTAPISNVVRSVVTKFSVDAVLSHASIPALLRSRMVVEVEDPADPPAAANGASHSLCRHTLNQLVPKTLVIPLTMVVRGELL